MADHNKSETPLDDNQHEHINPFVKAIKDQRLDFNYVTSLRKEVIQLIEPFRVRTLETADILDETILKINKISDEQRAFKQYIE
jgi:hypothetical protein